jgi:hypothetical protein
MPDCRVGDSHDRRVEADHSQAERGRQQRQPGMAEAATVGWKD